jgi:hypothetical protein
MRFSPPGFDLLGRNIVSGLIQESLGPPLPPAAGSTLAPVQATGASFVRLYWAGNATLSYRLILLDTSKVPSALESSGVILKTSYGTVLQDKIKTANGTGAFTHYNLTAATTYTYILQSYEADSVTLYDQASYTVTTLTTSLTLAMQDSTSIVASWPEAYPSASYQLRYKVSGANASTIQKTGTITDTTYTLTDLLADTSYDVDLYLVESGTQTSSTNLALGAASATTYNTTNLSLIIVACCVAVVAIGSIVVIVRRRSLPKIIK